ncbi:MAG: DUF1501 domain-containing protein [Planctomycetota bacterium]
MSPTRREFLKSSGVMLGAGVAGLSPRLAYGAPNVDGSQPPTLVVVYLRGGADPINTIIPFGDPLYAKIRPTIQVPARSQGRLPGVLPINRYFGFHPAMTEIAELYEQGMMCPILNCGSTHPTRSHFDAQDFMERAAPGVKSVTEGWLNRYLYATRTDHDTDLRALSLQETLPRSMRGQYSALAVPGYGSDRVMDTFENLYDCDSNKEAKQKNAAPGNRDGGNGGSESESGQPDVLPEDAMRQRIAEAGDEGIRKLREINEHVDGRRRGHSEGGYPNTRLGGQFRDLAKLIKAGNGLEVAALDYNGWDHHAYQGGSNGTMSDMLGNLSQSIGAFVKDMGPRMDRTLVLTMSEFGRTVRENGNSGTDHGRAGYMMAIGGMVNGGKIYGKWTGLERRNLVDGRDLKVHTDFRRVFAETLAGLYGFEADEHDFFPEYRSREKPVGFLRPITADG